MPDAILFPILDEAVALGAYCRVYSRPLPPVHFDRNQRWAWDLGWRLQEFLEIERAKDG